MYREVVNGLPVCCVTALQYSTCTGNIQTDFDGWAKWSGNSDSLLEIAWSGTLHSAQMIGPVSERSGYMSWYGNVVLYTDHVVEELLASPLGGALLGRTWLSICVASLCAARV